MQSIFLLGSERSGSNLLRTLLGNHSKISAPIAPHLCDVFFNQFKNYLPLDDEKRKILLVDINKYLNHSFNDWEVNFNLKPEGQLNSFIEFVDFSFTSKAKSEGKSLYFSKDNHNHRYALGILKDLPSAKFIYLYRDPRDQVASWMRTPVHLHTPYAAVIKWQKEQKAITALREFYQVSMCPLKYENLVDEPEKEIRRVLKYLNLDAEEACFQTNKNNKEAEKHPLWENINKPIIKNNYKKYKNILTFKDIELIETIAGKMMQELNYGFETDHNWSKGNPYIFAMQEKWKKSRSLASNKSFIENRMKILKDKNNMVKSIFSKFS